MPTPPVPARTPATRRRPAASAPGPAARPSSADAAPGVPQVEPARAGGAGQRLPVQGAPDQPGGARRAPVAVGDHGGVGKTGDQERFARDLRERDRPWRDVDVDMDPARVAALTRATEGLDLKQRRVGRHHTLHLDGEDVRSRGEYRVLDGVLHGHRGRRTPVAAALEPESHDPVGVHPDEGHAAGVGTEVGAHPVERPLHPGQDVVRVQVVEDEERPDEVVVGEGPQPVGLVGAGDQLDGALQPRAVEADQRPDQLLDALVDGRRRALLHLVEQRVDPLGQVPGLVGVHASPSVRGCRRSGPATRTRRPCRCRRARTAAARRRPG